MVVRVGRVRRGDLSRTGQTRGPSSLPWPAKLPLEGGATVDGLEIKSYGQAPWQVATAALEVTLRNDHVAHLTVLDMNGMPLRTVPLERADGALRFAFPAEAMYVVLH